MSRKNLQYQHQCVQILHGDFNRSITGSGEIGGRCCQGALARDLLFIHQENESAFDKSGSCVDRGWSRFVADQSVHPHGVQHQDDSQYRRRGRGLRLRVTGNGIVEQRHPLPDHTLIYVPCDRE